jgi:hypothetical protein
MDSKARCAGRAVHPMLVVFPVALCTATVAALLAYLGTQEAFWYRLAMIPLAMSIVTWVAMVIAASLRWMLVHPHHAGAKAAFLHADRATRELELNATVYDLADNLGHVDRRPSPAGPASPASPAGPAAKEAPPLSMRP